MTIALPGLPGLGDAVQPTPYASPQSQEAQRAYAKALMFGSVGKDGPQFPVVQSWTQGASNMVNALMGGLASRDADQKDRARYQTAIPDQPTKSSFSEGPSSEGHEKVADGDMSKQADAIASIESKGSGDYSAIGPTTRTGDKAYGKYQVMGANIPSWTKEVLGKEMSPQEFLSNQAAQDAVFKTKFAQGAGNDADRASVWFTGKPLAQGGNRSDGYVTGNQYVDRFNKAMGAPSQGSASAFAGPDAGSSANPAVAAMSAALQGKPAPQVAENGFQPVASKTAVPGQLPQPNGSGQYYDPRLIKPPPQYSADQVRAIMASPELSPEAKATAMQQFRQQGQPIELPYPGGHVVVDPRNPTNQQFIPDLQKGTTKAGDIEVPNYQTVGPQGARPNIQSYPVQSAPAAMGPRSEAAPTVAPAVAAQPAPAPIVPPGPVTAQNAPAAPVAPPSAPIQVASNDPTAAFAAAAGKAPLSPIEQQMMSMAKPDQPVTGLGPAAAPVPPAQEAKPEVIPVAAKGAQTPAQAASPLAKMAGNDDAIRNLVGGDVYDAYKQKKDADVSRTLGEDAAKAKIDVDKEAQNDSNKLATKKYDTLSTQGQAARKLMPNIDMALALTNDPRFHSGILAGPQDVVSRLKAGLFGDDKANAPNEVFDKLMAGTVLDTMKTALSGLGQVRLAEIGLLTKANANRTNSPASNRAVLEVSRRGIQSIDHLDDLGQQYASGDEVRDPVDGKTLLPANVGKDGEIAPRHGLDVGYDKLARKFVLDHPAFTPEETKHYETIFDTGKDPSAPEEPAAAGAPKVGETKEFDAPGGGKVTGVWDGKAWGPKK